MGSGLTGQQQSAAISRSMAGLQHEHYGRDSTKVNAYAINDMIVVVVRLKRSRRSRGKWWTEGSLSAYSHGAEFDRVMAGRYTHTVEQVTGRTVVALLSQAHVDPDIMLEALFLDQRFGSKVIDVLAEVIDLPEAVDARRDGREGRD